MELLKQLSALSAARGPTGGEWTAGGESVIDIARRLLTPLVDETWVDGHGNLIGVRKNPGKPRLLLDAHLDEVCMYVSGQEEGFLTFHTVGLDPRLLPAAAVSVLAKDREYPGVITCLPPHVLTEQERNRPFRLEDLYIDCGLSEDAARSLVGCAAVFATEPFRVGEHRVCGKSLDNRACFTMLLRTMELLRSASLPVEVYVLGSTQEESTAGGAVSACFALNPDLAIVTDATFGDSPDSPKDKTFPLGQGPAVGWGPHMNRTLSGRLRDCAETHGISHALEIMERATGTNAGAVQISREGVPTTILSIPLRYMHSPIEIVDLRDIEAAARLLAAFIPTLGEEASSCAS